MVRKYRTTDGNEPPATLQEWMQRTGLNATVLQILLDVKGFWMSPGTLSSIMSRSRRCSLVKAIAINEVTGVPVKNLIQWPPVMGGAVGETDRDESRNPRTVPAHP